MALGQIHNIGVRKVNLIKLLHPMSSYIILEKKMRENNPNCYNLEAITIIGKGIELQIRENKVSEKKF